MAPSSSKPVPPSSTDDSSSASDSEEEETESSEYDKAPPAPEPEGKKRKLLPPAEAKNPPPVHRMWSAEDEVRVLDTLAAHRQEHGKLPKPGALVASLAGRLDYKGPSRKEISDKVSKLKARYAAAAKKGVPSNGPERRLYDLSRIVWGDMASAAATAENGSEQAESNGGARRGFEEMCELYPYLAEEVMALDAENQGMLKRAFEKLADDTARALDEKVKKQRQATMELVMRRLDLTNEVLTTFIELAD